MSLRDDAEKIAKIFEGIEPTLYCNFKLLDIYEGNLLPYVKEDLKSQLSERAYKIAEKRIPPINLLKRLIDKLSTIYSKAPEREVYGTEQDGELWDWYIDNFNLNVEMQIANEYFNMHKACALEPYLDAEFKPRLRPIPFDRFFVCSDDMQNPLNPTHFIKVMGKTVVEYTDGKKTNSEIVTILHCYTDKEFLIIDNKGRVREEMMRKYETDGINPYGKIPFVYMNRSKTRVNPQGDTDLMAMTTLIPILITDINYALMFQSFSVIYTIDVDDEKLVLNPNTVISMKSDPTAGTKPEVGSIKPDVDSDKAFAAVQEQLALWLQSRNIRPGATGQVSGDNMASGISKMVDEMDTTNERKKTIPFFKSAEYDLFKLIKNYMHPVFIMNPSFEKRVPFTQDAVLSCEFHEQEYQKSRREMLEEVEIELKNGLVSQQTAIERVNPEWTDEQVNEEIVKIQSGFTVEVIEPNETYVTAEQTSAEETD